MILRHIYTLLTYLIQPLIALLLLKKSLKQPIYRQKWGERYAIYPAEKKMPSPNGILFHCASVGEVIAAIPLIKLLQKRYPKYAITVTTVTPTGYMRVVEQLGAQITHFYLPYDLPDAIQRFLNFISPQLIIIVETELWPNFILQASQRNIAIFVANGRLSPRSSKRYALFRSHMRWLLDKIDFIAAQDEVSRQRYATLGADLRRLGNVGNLKFDISIDERLKQRIAEIQSFFNLNGRMVWIAASTHEGEENLILSAHQKLRQYYPQLLLILVPRHPERFPVVEALIVQSKIHYIKRTDNQPIPPDVSVLLGNTMGELLVFYGLANIAFVGGSLVNHGGHNPLEPISLHIPVISGKHTFNFPEIFAKLRAVNGVIEVDTESNAIAQAVSSLIENANLSAQITAAADSVLTENQGSLMRHLALIEPFLKQSEGKH